MCLYRKKYFGDGGDSGGGGRDFSGGKMRREPLFLALNRSPAETYRRRKRTHSESPDTQPSENFRLAARLGSNKRNEMRSGWRGKTAYASRTPTSRWWGKKWVSFVPSPAGTKTNTAPHRRGPRCDGKNCASARFRTALDSIHKQPVSFFVRLFFKRLSDFFALYSFSISLARKSGGMFV